MATQATRIDLKEIVSLNLRFLQAYGIVFPEFKSWKTRLWYVLKATIFLGIAYVGMLLSEIINMVLVFGDLEKMTEASFLALTHIIQTTKLFYIIRYRNKLNLLINNINRKEFQPKSLDQYSTLQNYIKESKIISTTFLTAGVATCCFWGLNPFTEGGDVFLPLAGWYPFNTDRYPAFEITFAYQVIGSTINALSNISIDTLMSGLIMVVCAQLNILNDSLRNIRKYAAAEMDGNDVDSTGDLSVELQRKMNEKLVECVVHHRYILEFANEITFLFAKSILGQFVVSVVIICITLFEITLLPWGSLKFFSLILYQFCMLLEIFLLCYYGNEVILQSMETTKFAYCGDWIDCSTEFKRNLLFFMTRSQVPLRLYAGGFFALSLETFVKILKSSWSYFAVLNRVHSRE
nr:odorant receptor [Semanotus bifasciatus]